MTKIETVQCVICLESVYTFPIFSYDLYCLFNKKYELSCNHIFHEKCIMKFIRNKYNNYIKFNQIDENQKTFSENCPLCRKEFSININDFINDVSNYENENLETNNELYENDNNELYENGNIENVYIPSNLVSNDFANFLKTYFGYFYNFNSNFKNFFKNYNFKNKICYYYHKCYNEFYYIRYIRLYDLVSLFLTFVFYVISLSIISFFVIILYENDKNYNCNYNNFLLFYGFKQPIVV